MTAGGSSQTEVTYTYRIVNLTSWANQPETRQAFPDIAATLNEASKVTEKIALRSTNEGWQVDSQ